MSQLRLKEPKFMKEIHRIRSEISKLTEKERNEEQDRLLKKYKTYLGHLYVEK